MVWPRCVGENRLFAEGPFTSFTGDGEGRRLAVDGEFRSDGIAEADFATLTLCERASEAFVGVIRLAASRGSAFCEVTLRAGAATEAA